MTTSIKIKLPYNRLFIQIKYAEISNMNIGSKYGLYFASLFILASAFCTLVFLRGFLKWLPDTPDITDDRYALLTKYLGHVPEIQQYIATHRNRAPLYKQFYWMIVDCLGAYLVIPDPTSSIFIILI